MTSVMTAPLRFFCRTSALAVTTNITRYIAKPYQHAGCPRKYGHGSLNAQLPLRSLTALRYPEKRSPADDKIKRVIIFGFMNIL